MSEETKFRDLSRGQQAGVVVIGLLLLSFLAPLLLRVLYVLWHWGLAPWM